MKPDLDKAKQIYLTEKEKGNDYYRRSIKKIQKELSLSAMAAAIITAEIDRRNK